MSAIIFSGSHTTQLRESERLRKRRKTSIEIEPLKIPDDIVGKIFSYLSFKEICFKFPQLCRKMEKLFKEKNNILSSPEVDISTGYSSKEIVKILAIIKRMKVEKLYFDGWDSLKARKVTRAELSSLGQLQNLRDLEIRGSAFDGLNLKYFQFLNLGRLVIREVKLLNSSLRYLGKMKIKHLNLSQTGVSDRGLEHLKGLPLEYINLSDNPVTDKGLKCLREMPIKVLQIEDTAIKGSGIQYIQPQRVEKICLCNTAYENEGLEHLASMNLLRHLCLGNTEVSNTGLRHITHLKLRYLNLGNTDVDDEGVVHLSGMTLSELRLKGCRALKGSDAALDSFLKLPLRRLDISDTLISKKKSRWLHRNFKTTVAIKI